MVIVVATVLSMAATLLKPQQEKNLEVEKKKSMLESINIPADRNNAEGLYDKYIKESMVLDRKGEKKEGIDAFTVEMKLEEKKAPESQSLAVFYATPEDGEKVIILPLEGKRALGSDLRIHFAQVGYEYCLRGYFRP